MLNNVSSEDILINSGVNQQNKVAGVDKNAASQNAYQKYAEFDDSLEVSEEAKKLLEKEQEIQKYKNIVMESLERNEKVGNILELIGKGEYITNDDLADAMLGDDEFMSTSDLLDMLFTTPTAS